MKPSERISETACKIAENKGRNWGIPEKSDLNEAIVQYLDEEWGAWKFVSGMLDSPDEHGIYPTSKCYEQIHDFVMEQKIAAKKQVLQEVLEKGIKIMISGISGKEYKTLGEIPKLVSEKDIKSIASSHGITL